MVHRIGLTIFVLTVAFYSCNCTPAGFRKIGSHETSSNNQKTVKTWYLSNINLPWSLAIAACSYHKMELTIFSSNEEKQILTSLVLALHAKPRGAYIAYTDLGHEGHFTDMYDHPIQVSLDFQAGEPTNSGGDENCVQWENKQGTYLSNDIKCSIPCPYICQKVETSTVKRIKPNRTKRPKPDSEEELDPR